MRRLAFGPALLDVYDDGMIVILQTGKIFTWVRAPDCVTLQNRHGLELLQVDGVLYAGPQPLDRKVYLSWQSEPPSK